tara:strand:+ start:148 stop:486 length:339 start_codon:yes stop_codon:yes gene_type:complete
MSIYTYRDRVQQEIEAHKQTIMMLSNRIEELKRHCLAVADIPDMKICDTELSLRTYQALRRKEFVYISEVILYIMECGWTKLSMIRGLGKHSLQELKEVLEELGFTQFYEHK